MGKLMTAPLRAVRSGFNHGSAKQEVSMADQVTPGQRRTTMGSIAVSAVVTAILWYLLVRFLPVPVGAEPLLTALACSALAALLALVPGVEAIAHERLFTPGINPLAGFETHRMRVNFHYLSNTLEQFVIFAAGLVAVSAYASPRLLVIIAIMWVLERWAFWIGYHLSPLLRGFGAPGMLQSMIVLFYVAYRWGGDNYGQAAGVALVITFLIIEAILFWAVKRPAQ
jgi:hypothetical protein